MMKDALEDFQRTIESSAERLSALTEEELAVARSAEKWTAKQILGHLIDSAANNHQRFVRAQFTDHLVFDGYDQEQWVASQHYHEESWPLLVGLWKSYNLHLLHVMSCAPAEALRRPCTQHTLNRIAFKTVEENETTTLEYLMLDYIAHLKHHLGQIFVEDN